jgi:enoyl-CoA hydratase/carnithine racemase
MQAKEYGLVTHLSNQDNIDNELSNLIKEILENSPTAIRLGLEAYNYITNNPDQHKYLLEMLNKAIKSNDAKEGINAFKEKRKPNWKGN